MKAPIPTKIIIGLVTLWSILFVLLSPFVLIAQSAPVSSWIGCGIIAGCFTCAWGETLIMLKEGRL